MHSTDCYVPLRGNRKLTNISMKQVSKGPGHSTTTGVACANVRASTKQQCPHENERVGECTRVHSISLSFEPQQLKAQHAYAACLAKCKYTADTERYGKRP